jgi:hypothetical protein
LVGLSVWNLLPIHEVGGCIIETSLLMSWLFSVV